jgi:hypothetical protein
VIEFRDLGIEGTSMTALRRYQVSRLLIWPAALLYAAVAFWGRPPGQIELFPFFKWSLFTFGPALRADIVLFIDAVDGRSLPEPALFYDMKDTFAAARSKDPRLMKLLDRWSFALRTGDAAGASSIRAVVESTFMREAATVDYRLALIGYDPVRRLRDGSIAHIEVRGEFRKAP